MTNFSIYRKTTGTLKIPRKTSGDFDIYRKTAATLKIDMPLIVGPPTFVSAEVGLIDAYTIDMLFDRALWDIKIPDVTDLLPVFTGGTPYSDWFMPSADELNQMYVNLYLFGVGNFDTSFFNWYWSSSEFSATQARLRIFRDGSTATSAKSGTFFVRACRSFTATAGVYALRDTGPAGGLIFYIDGTTYYEAAPSDQSVSQAWSNITNLSTGATGTAIGTGATNTPLITAQAGHTSSAAKLCEDYTYGVYDTITLITISGAHVYATLARAITYGETGTIQYILNVLESKQLQGTSGAKVAAFTESVTNNIAQTIPMIQSITVENAAPTVFVLTYDLALDDTSTPATSAFTIVGHTVGSVLVTGSTVKVTVSERVYYGDSDTLAYTAPATNMIKSTMGGEAASFTATAVTNNVTQLAFQNANTLMWLLSEDLSTITKDGGNLVSRWNDRQASGRDLIQATGTNQPLWSADGVLLDGIDNFMASATFTLGQPVFIYAVLKQVTWTLNDQLWDGFTALSGAVMQSASTPGLRLWAGAFGSQNNNLAVNTFGIIRAYTNGVNSFLQINETAAVVNNVGAGTMNGLTLGRRTGSVFYSNIQVKEIIIRNTADDASVQAAIYAYLSAKYSI